MNVTPISFNPMSIDLSPFAIVRSQLLAALIAGRRDVPGELASGLVGGVRICPNRAATQRRR